MWNKGHSVQREWPSSTGWTAGVWQKLKILWAIHTVLYLTHFKIGQVQEREREKQCQASLVLVVPARMLLRLCFNKQTLFFLISGVDIQSRFLCLWPSITNHTRNLYLNIMVDHWWLKTQQVCLFVYRSCSMLFSVDETWRINIMDKQKQVHDDRYNTFHGFHRCPITET